MNEFESFSGGEQAEGFDPAAFERFQEKMRENAKQAKKDKAQEKKQLNGLNNLEKRLIKAEKRKHKDFLDRIEILKKDLFPNNSFQERQLNFSSFFNSNKKNFLSFLIEKIDPFNNSFNVVKY